MMIKSNNLKKTAVTIFFVVLFSLLFESYRNSVEAYVGGINGTVYMNYKGNNIELPGVRIYREDGDFDYLDLTNRQSCEQHVRTHQFDTNYGWDLFKYNCSNLIPQTYEGVTYSATECRDRCKYADECLYQNTQNQGEWLCDDDGTILDPSCKTKCNESGANCRPLVNVPLSKPVAPTETEIQTAIDLICRADRGGVETTTNNDGFYTMAHSTSPPINNPAPLDPSVKQLWGSALCPSGPLGNVSLQGGDWTKLNYCGLNCLENKHRIKAYLTKETFDWLEREYGSIPIDRNDLKGGGYWKVRSSGGYYYTSTENSNDYFLTFKEAQGNTVWDGYQPTEWYNLLIGNNQILPGFNFYWIPPSEPNRPDIVDIPETPTPWIGTSTEGDNGPSCYDNNPYAFNIVASDPDGSKDINRIEFSLAGSGQLGYGDVRWWPLRIMFAQKWPGSKDNMFYVRDKVVKTKGAEYCFDKDKNRVSMKGSSDIWCFGTDSHNKSEAKMISTTLNGRQVELYYLAGDISVYNEGYSFKLLGSQNQNDWSKNTFVAYEKGGNIVESQFRVQFEGDQNDPWTGEYHNMWRVEDMTALDDNTYNISGEQEHRTDPTTHHRLSKTRLDFKPPTVELSEPKSEAGNIVTLTWSASDTGGSLLKDVYGEAEHSEGKDASAILNTTRNITYKPWLKSEGGDYNGNSFEPLFLWTLQNINKPTVTATTEEVDLKENNTGTISFIGGAVDNACNNSDNPAGSQYVSFRPWLLTRAGLLFSGGAMDLKVLNLAGNDNLCPGSNNCPSFNSYPYNLPKYDVALSTELLSTGSSLTSDNLVNQTSAKIYAIGGYSSERNNKLWFNELYRVADKNLKQYSERYEYYQGVGSLTGSIRSTRCSDLDRLCVLESNSSGLTINSPVTCDRESIIFVRGDLNINAPVKATSGSNGCVFITTGDVNINVQQNGDINTPYAQYDRLSMYVVSDGQIKVSDSDKGYGLQVWGGLLSFGQNNGFSFDLLRSLGDGKNAEYPTYMVVHDPRYFEITRQLLAPEREGYKREVGDKP